MEPASEPAGRSVDARHVANRDGLYSIPVVTIDGREETLDSYRGNVLLIVNVASQCGFTPQYAGLETLYRRYKDRGFTVLGFPCDQFGNQEPGTNEEIRQFCSMTYDVTFPMFAKIDVNGPNEHPLYAHLKSHARGILGTTAIKWNFTKFLVSRDGTVLARYGSRDTPESIGRDDAFVSALG
ncbi:MAG TPA: glutathione peroxidase [Gemmatimonadaceae bacterium]|nr:glutathione peroxidase [Gemmatimonadaceae bacterium]